MPHVAVQEFGELDGVLSFSEMAMPLVARLTEQLGLPGNTPAVSAAAACAVLTRLDCSHIVVRCGFCVRSFPKLYTPGLHKGGVMHRVMHMDPRVPDS